MRLYRYVARRLILLIPVLIGVSIVIFTLTRVTGNPAAAYINDKMTQKQIDEVMEKYHFDEPIYVQYGYWLQGVIEGDWGWSKYANQPVTDAIAQRFTATAELAIVSMIISIILGIWLGTLAAIRRNRPFDHTTRVVSLIGVSIPVFWLGLILKWIFSWELGWLPSKDQVSTYFVVQRAVPHDTGFLLIDSLLHANLDLFFDYLTHLILPSITLAFATIAIILRIQRNSMLEVLGLDYVKTARAKGVPEKAVIRKHARRNALIPTTTVIGLSFGALLGGAVLTESIFNWNGLGRWAAGSILALDSTSILGFVLLTALIYVTANLLVDLFYAYLDPRVRLE